MKNSEKKVVIKRIAIKKRISILIIIFSLLMGGSNLFIINHKNELLLSNLQEYSRSQKIILEREMDFKFKVLENVASDITDINNMKQYITELNEISKASSYLKMGIVDHQGNGYLNNGEKINVSKCTYFKESLKGKNYISSVFEDEDLDIDVNAYSVPIFEQEKKNVIGVVFIVLKAEEFTKLLQIQLDAPERYGYIIESDGTLVTISDVSKSWDMTNFFDKLEEIQSNKWDRKEVISNIKQEKAGMFKAHNDKDKYTYYTPLHINDWYLVTIMTEDILLKQISPFITLARIMTVAFAFIFFVAFLWNLLDVVRHTKHMENIAWQDELTKGKNKIYLRERLFSVVKRERQQKSMLINININNFRNINDLNSNKIGDQILMNMYYSIEKQCNQNEVVVHTYADEFLVVWFYSEIEELYRRIKQLESRLSNMRVGDSRYHIYFSVGMVKIEQEYDFDTLYSRTVMARKKCKEIENTNVYLFEESLIEELANASRFEKEIKEAIANKEFEAFFQAQIDSNTECIIGAEALVRWRKKDGTIVSPFFFIPYAEKNGLIQQIDEIVFEDVCKKLKICLEQGIEVPVSVNISRAYIKNMAYLRKLKKLTDKYEIPAYLIHLEITESGFLDNEEILVPIFEEIKGWGFVTSLDDFGTGYSSIKTLNDLHFDILKIDKSFVDKIGDKRTEQIILYTINMAKSFQMRTIAEGIENKEQFEFLRAHGCQMIQGYYFAKPMEFQSFFNMLLSENEQM